MDVPGASFSPHPQLSTHKDSIGLTVASFVSISRQSLSIILRSVFSGVPISLYSQLLTQNLSFVCSPFSFPVQFRALSSHPSFPPFHSLEKVLVLVFERQPPRYFTMSLSLLNGVTIWLSLHRIKSTASRHYISQHIGNWEVWVVFPTLLTSLYPPIACKVRGNT